MSNQVMKVRPLPPKERLHERFTYSFVEGVLYWRHYPKRKLAGSKAPSRMYCHIKFDQVMYQRHRLIWAYFYGDPGTICIDHINNVSDDDRIENLRLATISENRWNSKMYRTNISGFKGVYAVPNKRSASAPVRWRADIYVHRRRICLGTHSTKEEAAAAYAEAAKRLHGEFVGHLQ